MNTSAVLFLVFNRPDVTTRVFESIRKAKPSKLYIAADGARPYVNGEMEKVSSVREIATSVDWCCDVKTLFREQNLGCKKAVSSAITWFFEHEEEGIILEDDCVPHESFFPYCLELLERYRNDTRVMMISGNNFQSHKNIDKNYSYYFSKYGHIWGWATWRRAWNHFDGNLSSWPEIKENGLIDKIAGDDSFSVFWADTFDACYAGKIDTWDYHWVYSCWVQSGLVMIPNVNLVSNIGFGEDATHTNTGSILMEIPAHEIKLPLSHPPYIIQDRKADCYIGENYYYAKAHKATDVSSEKSVIRNLLGIIQERLHLKKGN